MGSEYHQWLLDAACKSRNRYATQTALWVEFALRTVLRLLFIACEFRTIIKLLLSPPDYGQMWTVGIELVPYVSRITYSRLLETYF